VLQQDRVLKADDVSHEVTEGLETPARDSAVRKNILGDAIGLRVVTPLDGERLIQGQVRRKLDRFWFDAEVSQPVRNQESQGLIAPRGAWRCRGSRDTRLACRGWSARPQPEKGERCHKYHPQANRDDAEAYSAALTAVSIRLRWIRHV
jgi:hypothetical protein